QGARHVPQRRCIGCGERRAKAQLARFVAVAEDGVHVVVRDDRSQRAGRGLYVCPQVACFERAVARRAFGRGARVRGELRVDPQLGEGFESGVNGGRDG
ncbi:unnamed protein product, partial [Phaeothamnion confervicola]